MGAYSKSRTIAKAPSFQDISGDQTIGGQTINPILFDSSDKLILGTCTTVPSDGQAGFAKGCELIDTDVSAGVTCKYINIGTSSSCQFVLTTGVSDSGGIVFLDDVTIGNSITDTLILKGRVSTSVEAGAALSIDGTYTLGEAWELRYTITTWSGIGNQFNGVYFRTQSDADNASGSLRGAEFLAVANASGVSDLKGVFAEAYVKGDTTETINTVYGLHGEISFDAGRVNSVTLTEAPALLGKILSGKVADYTKFHGAILRFGDMDGGSRTYGNGILIEDDASTSGTSSLTTGINITLGCTNVLAIAGTYTSLIRITGAGTNLLSFDAVEGPVSTQATALNGVSSSHKLALNIDGVGTVYLPVVTTF